MTDQVTPSAFEAERLIEWIPRYFRTRVDRFTIDERRCIPPYVALDFGNQGLLGLEVPEQLGGRQLSHGDALRVIEALGSEDITLALFVGVHNVLGIRPILKYGAAPLRDSAVPLMAAGRELGAFAITEQGAGSNPTAIEAHAECRDGEWTLNGTKWWSGNAAWAGWINVFVKTPGVRGAVTAFALRQGMPGLRQGPESLTMGVRGMVQNAIHLEDVHVPDANRLGEVGQGMFVAMDAMMYARLGIAAIAAGAMKRCVTTMVDYASNRLVSGGRLLDNVVTEARIRSAILGTVAVSALVARVAAMLDSGRDVSADLYAACKTTAPELLWDTADRCMQLLGGRGYDEASHVPQMFRDARLLRIFEGPTETLHTFLGMRLLTASSDAPTILQEWGVGNAAEELIQLCGRRKAKAEAAWPYRMRQIAPGVGEATAAALLAAAARGTPAEQWASLRLARYHQQIEMITKEESDDFAPLLNLAAGWRR